MRTYYKSRAAVKVIEIYNKSNYLAGNSIFCDMILNNRMLIVYTSDLALYKRGSKINIPISFAQKQKVTQCNKLLYYC